MTARLRPSPRRHRARRVRALLRRPASTSPATHLDLRPRPPSPPTPSGSNTTSPGSSDSLPNGYCGRPPQQDCPHPNACLTCPDFQTTPEFLDIHRRQAHEQPACSSPAPTPTASSDSPTTSAASRTASTGSSPRSKPSGTTRSRDTRRQHPPSAAGRRPRATTQPSNAVVARSKTSIAPASRSPSPPLPAPPCLTRLALQPTRPARRDHPAPPRRRSCRRAHDAGSATRVHRITPPAPRLAHDDEITRLRADNAALRGQLARSLGEQRLQR